MTDSFTTHRELWIQLGLTLAHFLWQGALIAALLAIALRLMRRRSPNLRYGLCGLAMLLMAVSPVITLLHADSQPAPVSEIRTGNASAGALPERTGTPNADVIAIDDRAESAWPAHPGSQADAELMPASASVNGDLRAASPTFAAAHSHAPTPLWLAWTLQISALAWTVGVLALSIRLTVGWLRLRGFYRSQAAQVPPVIEALARGLGERLGLRRPVRVLAAGDWDEPVAFGLLRPVVLLPIAAITNTPVELIEAMIAHELAHIRRYDLWINLLQRVIETLLFYHPAVWWVSARMRVERELCCDDLAVRVTGRRADYASALLEVYRFRQAPATPAMAAALLGSSLSLKARVQRVLQLSSTHEEPVRARFWLAGPLSLLLAAGFTLMAVTDSAMSRNRAVAATASASQPATIASTQPANARYFVRLVVDKERMTFQGAEVTWDSLPKALEKVPNRAHTVLEIATGSMDMTLRQVNEAQTRAMMLSRDLGFEYLSDVGEHPLGTLGDPTLELPIAEARGTTPLVPAGTLEFRIAVNPPGTGRQPEIASLDACRRDLADNGPSARRSRGEAFQWFEYQGNSKRPPFGTIVEAYAGRPYILLANRAPYAMQAVNSGPKAWRVERVYARDDTAGGIAIGFDLDDAGAKALAKLTTANLKAYLAVLVDGQVVSAAVIASPIGKSGMISGSFSPDQAEAIAAKLFRAAATAPASEARASTSQPVGRLIGIAPTPDQWSNNTSPARGKAALEFRVAVNQPGSDLQPQITSLDECQRDLAANGPSARQARGDEFQWFEYPGDNEVTPEVIVEEHAGRRYMLLADRAPYMMPAVTGGPGAWRVERAYARDDRGGRPSIGFDLDDAGEKALTALTTANMERQLAVLVDGKVVAMATIKSPIGKSGMISGSFSLAEAEAIAAELRMSGASSAPAPRNADRSTSRPARSNWQALLNAIKPAPALRQLETGGRADDPAVAEIARILAVRRRAATELRNLRIVADCHREVRGEDGIWKPTPIRASTRSWYESLAPEANFRIDFDPEILDWINGAAPYSENRYTFTWDGDHFVKFNVNYNHDTRMYASSVAEDHPYLPPSVRWNAAELYNGLIMVKDPRSYFITEELSKILEIDDQLIELGVAEVSRDGRKLARVSLGLRGAGGGEEMLFDADRGYALVSQATTQHGAGPARSRQVTAGTQLSPPLWYPKNMVSYPGLPNQRYVTEVREVGFYRPADAEAIFAAEDIVLGKPSLTPPAGFAAK